MPYLQYLFCEKCGEGHQLDLDYIGTLEAYAQEGRVPAIINTPTLVWDYLIYSCGSCATSFKYTIRDVERRVREHLSAISAKYKDYLDELTEYNADEARRKSGEFFINRDRELRQRLTSIYGTKV